jgi:hypothetical protein
MRHLASSTSVPRVRTLSHASDAPAVLPSRWIPDGERKGLPLNADFVEIRRAENEQRKRLFLKALRASLGIVRTACRMSGVHRNTVRDWLRGDAAFRDRVDEINERALDFTEAQLFRLIRQGDTTAIIFFLKTKGRARGYA